MSLENAFLPPQHELVEVLRTSVPRERKTSASRSHSEQKRGCTTPDIFYLGRISPRTFVETCESESCLPMGTNGNFPVDVSMEALA